MEPLILDGKKILMISYLFFKPKLNDIVAFKVDGKIFIKRIFRSENNKYFLLGENKSDSLDSRKFGYVDRKNILGKIIYF